jgi:hypothetical protein
MWDGDEGFMPQFYVPLCDVRNSISKNKANQTFYEDMSPDKSGLLAHEDDSSKHGGSITPQVFRFSAATEEEEEDQFKPSAIDFRSQTPVTFRSISVESLNSLQMAQIVESGRQATSESKSIGIDC